MNHQCTHSGYRAVGLALVSVVLLHDAARADEVLLAASRDTTLYEDDAGALGNGSGEYLFSGSTEMEKIRRTLVGFDVPGTLPAGATVTAVRLRLYLSKTISGNQTTALHRVLSDWGEGASNAPSQEGTGTEAAEGDATWMHRFFDQAPWTAPGGDFEPSASATVDVGLSVGTYTWESTPGLVADVQGWLDAPETNFGWIVIGEEGEPGTAKRFASRENPIESRRPALVVSFTPPPVPFRRGDCNDDGDTTGVTDAIYLLGYAFLGTEAPSCLRACDVNGDGEFSGVSDAIYQLSFNFLGGPPPPAPFPECGVGPPPSEAEPDCATPPGSCVDAR